MGNEQFYRPTDNARTSEAWQKNRTLITYGEPRPRVEWKSYEPLPDLTVEACSLIQPFASPVDERVIGVIRCRGKRPAFKGMKSIFTEDDVGLMEALLAPCLPYFSRWAELARQDRLAAALWHELRNPVSKIRAFVEQAKSSLGRLDPQVKSYQNINDLLSRALRDIGVVRATAEDIAVLMSPTGKILLDRGSVFFVEDVLEPALSRLPPDSRVQYDYVGDFPLISGDARRLEQVFANLVANAYRAAPTGDGLKITFRATIEEDQYLVVATEDLGSGFPLDSDPNAFFLTPPDVPASLSRRKPVGLWVSDLLIRAMGGTIAVTQPRNPTIITVRLPLLPLP